jgi:mRNA interferase RelE/StbE
MATYRIRFRPSARRDFAKLPPLIKRRIGRAIDALAEEPRPAGALLLSGSASPTWRIRAGDYRVLYEVLGDELVVLVVAVGHRREIYRRRRINEPGAPYEASAAPHPHGGRSWTSELLHRLG